MVAGIQVKFGVIRDEVTPALARQNKGYKTSDRAIGELKGSYKTLEREAVRALKNTRGEQDKLNRVTKGLKRLVDRNIISQKEMNRAVKGTSEKLGLSKNLMGDLGKAARSAVGSYLSVAAAVGTVVAGIRDAIQLERERQIITGDSVEAATNFSLLTRGDVSGSRDQLKKIAIAQSFGQNKEELDILLDSSQSILSALEEGKFGPKTQRAFEAVLRARFVAIPVELGTDLVTQGKEQGAADPTSFIRKTLIGGQLSSQKASELAKSIPALSLFDDKDFGFAVATRLVSKFKQRAPTITRAVGGALISQKVISNLGLDPDARQQEVFEELFKRGIRTPRQLVEVGTVNKREVEGLVAILDQYDRVLREKQDFIDVGNRPGEVLRQRLALEAEDPLFKTKRLTDQSKVESFLDKAFDPGAAARELVSSHLAAQLRNVRTPLQPFGVRRGVAGFRTEQEGVLTGVGVSSLLNPIVAAQLAFNIIAKGGIDLNTELLSAAAASQEQTEVNTRKTPGIGVLLPKEPEN